MSTGDELRRAAKQAERSATSSALDRYANFPLSAGANGPCPYCWIERGQRVSIRPIGDGTSTEDFFQCGNGHSITVPF